MADQRAELPVRDWTQLLEDAECWTIVMDALAYQAAQEPLPEALEEMAWQAGSILAAAALVQGGLSIDTAEELFTTRDYTVKFSYDGKTDEIGVEILWDDGTKTVATNGTAA